MPVSDLVEAARAANVGNPVVAGSEQVGDRDLSAEHVIDGH